MHYRPPAQQSAYIPAADFGFDWEAERRWWDGTWFPFVFMALGGAVVAGGFFLDGGFGFALVTAATWAVIMAVSVPWGLRLRRRLAAEAGVPARAVPVLTRRLQKGRIPHGRQARNAMTVLARRFLQAARYNRWAHPLLVGVLLLNGVTQGARGHWVPFSTWCAGAALMTVVVVVNHRTASRIARTLSHLEAPCPEGPR